MNLNEYTLYIIFGIFVLLCGFLCYSLCFRSEKVDTITVERYNPRILIADNGILILQSENIQDYYSICDKKFKSIEPLQNLDCDHKNCYKEKIGCKKCLKEPTEYTHLII